MIAPGYQSHGTSTTLRYPRTLSFGTSEVLARCVILVVVLAPSRTTQSLADSLEPDRTDSRIGQTCLVPPEAQRVSDYPPVARAVGFWVGSGCPEG